MSIIKMYTIEPKAAGGFTLTIPENSIPFGFSTKDAALEHVRALVGKKITNGRRSRTEMTVP